MTEPEAITLRPATEADEALLLEWANDPVTRGAGFRPDLITADEHRRWFADRIRSATSRLYIGMSGSTPVGQVRLDRLPDGRVEVGIAVAPEARGRGMGGAILRRAMDEGRRDGGLAARTFQARTRPHTAASRGLFRGAGFGGAGETTVGGDRCLVYEADA